MLNVDLPKYSDLQKNNSQWGNQLDILFISIVYVVWIRSVHWFGDALIDFDTATRLGLRDLNQFVLPDAPVIWVSLHVHMAPVFAGSGANHFCTLF